MLFVVAYDIPEDGTRTQVAKELENWGWRVQYSVFECDLNESKVKELEKRLGQLTTGVDQIRIYRICQACRSRAVILGGKPVFEDRPFYQV